LIELRGKHSTAKIMRDDVDSNVLDMVSNILNHPACTNPVAIQADTHLGKGIVIGFTMEMSDKIVPSWIGVDIGCNVLSVNLGKLENVNYKDLDRHVRENIPTGTRIHDKSPINFEKDFDWEGLNVKGKAFAVKYKEKFGKDVKFEEYTYEWFKGLFDKLNMKRKRAELSIGTLGGGNHYHEMGISKETGDHWYTIHSGSRNFGKCVCNYHEDVAKETLKNKREVELANKMKEILSDNDNLQNRGRLIKEAKEGLGLNFETDIKGVEFLEGDNAVDYLRDMLFAQEYAKFNCETMLKIVLEHFNNVEIKDTIHSVHNLIDFDDWIIRKGAIRSYKGERMIIPFNMRDGNLIVEGKSNPEYNFSAPHGAGRVMSRTVAKKELKLEDFKEQMKGIYSTSVKTATLDESPGAYKDAELIELLISDTCDVLEHVIPTYNMKDSSTFSYRSK